MLRTLFCTAALFGFGAVASAGELDQEAGPKSALPTLTASAPATTAPAAGSELDKESPQPAYHWHGGWGHRGFGGGWGWGGGWGHRGWGWGGGWGGWGYRGLGWGGGWGGFYRPWGFYGGFSRPFYGWGYPGLGYSSFSIGFGRGLGWYW